VLAAAPEKPVVVFDLRLSLRSQPYAILAMLAPVALF